MWLLTFLAWYIGKIDTLNTHIYVAVQLTPLKHTYVYVAVQLTPLTHTYMWLFN
jgi:hypothetical protein